MLYLLTAFVWIIFSSGLLRGSDALILDRNTIEWCWTSFFYFMLLLMFSILKILLTQQNKDLFKKIKLEIRHAYVKRSNICVGNKGNMEGSWWLVIHSAYPFRDRWKNIFHFIYILSIPVYSIYIYYGMKYKLHIMKPRIIAQI